MDKDIFLKKLQELLQRDAAIGEHDSFADIEEWDSLSMMATTAFLKKNFNVLVEAARLRKLVTVRELLDLAHVA